MSMSRSMSVIGVAVGLTLAGGARAQSAPGVPAEKQEATMKDVTDEANKVLEQEAPPLRASTQAVVQSSVAPLLARFESLVPEMKRTVGENVAKANAAQIQPKMTELQSRVGLRLRTAVGQ